MSSMFLKNQFVITNHEEGALSQNYYFLRAYKTSESSVDIPIKITDFKPIIYLKTNLSDIAELDNNSIKTTKQLSHIEINFHVSIDNSDDREKKTDNTFSYIINWKKGDKEGTASCQYQVTKPGIYKTDCNLKLDTIPEGSTFVFILSAKNVSLFPAKVTYYIYVKYEK